MEASSNRVGRELFGSESDGFSNQPRCVPAAPRDFKDRWRSASDDQAHQDNEHEALRYLGKRHAARSSH